MTVTRSATLPGDPPLPPTRVAVVGAGFWTRFQLAAWAEHRDATVVAIANRTVERARALAQEFGIPSVYDDLTRLLDQEGVDVVDIITAPETHADLIRVAADRGIPVICQKPLAQDLATARAAAAYCVERGVPLWIHENYRWQTGLREAANQLHAGVIGTPFRAHLEFATGFPVFSNQPFLAQLERMIVADLGVHLLDVARFTFGEARSVVAQVHSVNPGIAGEDVATIMLDMGPGVTVICELSFASRFEIDVFPETLLRVEGSEGTLEVRPGFRLAITRDGHTTTRSVAPPVYPWADPFYAVSHASIVPCITDLLAAVRGEHEAETTAAEHLRTLALVEAAYESVARGIVVALPPAATPA
jgi:D-apiose dehydrogenase